MPRVPRKSWTKGDNPQFDLTPLLNDDCGEDGDILMSFRIMDETAASGDFRGWRKIELLVDSGAADSVLPEGMLDDYEVALGQKFKEEVNYLTADGGRLPNMGESTIRFHHGRPYALPDDLPGRQRDEADPRGRFAHA